MQKAASISNSTLTGNKCHASLAGHSGHELRELHHFYTLNNNHYRCMRKVVLQQYIAGT
jgi:hypothetical protein